MVVYALQDWSAKTAQRLHRCVALVIPSGPMSLKEDREWSGKLEFWRVEVDVVV